MQQDALIGRAGFERYRYLSKFLNSVRLRALPVDDEVRVLWERGDFLGMRDADSVCDDFKVFGFFSVWHEQGYGSIRVAVTNRELGCSCVEVFTEIGGVWEYLLQAVVWVEDVEIGGVFYRSLSVEHLLLQQPGVEAERILPGQYFAGSGQLRRFFNLLRYWGEAAGAACLCAIPEYFHSAVMFSSAFHYADEVMQEIFDGYCRRFLANGRPDGLAVASHLFESGQVYDDSGNVYRWPTELMVYFL